MGLDLLSRFDPGIGVRWLGCCHWELLVEWEAFCELLDLLLYFEVSLIQ